MRGTARPRTQRVRIGPGRVRAHAGLRRTRTPAVVPAVAAARPRVSCLELSRSCLGLRLEHRDQAHGADGELVPVTGRDPRQVQVREAASAAPGGEPWFGYSSYPTKGIAGTSALPGRLPETPHAGVRPIRGVRVTWERRGRRCARRARPGRRPVADRRGARARVVAAGGRLLSSPSVCRPRAVSEDDAVAVVELLRRGWRRRIASRAWQA